METANKNRPVDRIREGAVSIAIFRNEGKHGPFHTAKVLRCYKHTESDEWVNTSSGYNFSGLEKLIKAAVQARGKIEQLDAIEQERFREAQATTQNSQSTETELSQGEPS